MAADRCELLCLDLPHAEALRRSRPDVEHIRAAAARAGALADPTRLGIALALRDGGNLCVCDLAWVVGRAQNLVSHHLRALRMAGLVSSRRDGRTVVYTLTDEGGALLGSLLEVPAEVSP